jgi:murein L,D-transpeptidase YcbB/YkuD
MTERGFHFTGSENMFDENTQDVLRRFQQEKHLEVDGKLGPMSWRAAWELPVVG